MFSSSQGLHTAMLADTVDYDRMLWPTKLSVEALYVSLFKEGTPYDHVFTNIALATLYGFGFRDSAKTQPENALICMKFLIAWGAIPLVLSGFALFGYGVTARVHETILLNREKRVSRIKVTDPLSGRSLPISDEDHIQFLDHFRISELRNYVQRGSAFFKSMMFVEEIIGIAVFVAMVYLGAKYPTSETFPVAIMVAMFAICYVLFNTVRIWASTKMGAYGKHEIMKHIQIVQDTIWNKNRARSSSSQKIVN